MGVLYIYRRRAGKKAASNRFAFLFLTSMANKKEIKDWYEKRYAQPHPGRRPLNAYPYLLDFLATKNGGRLLDVACGAGFLLRAAREKGLGAWGTDISEAAVFKARENAPASHLCVSDAENLSFKEGSFDYITCLGALEHFVDMRKGLMEMKRVSAKNAVFCIVVPNVSFLLWRLQNRKGTEQAVLSEQLLSFRQWEDLFSRQGFRTIGVHRDRWYLKFGAADFVGVLRRFAAWFIWFCIPLKFNYQFVFILKKQAA